MRSRKGFTIIEMAVVMAILVIIAAITYPRIAGYMEMNREMQRSNHEYMVNKALMQYYALTGGYYKAPYNTGDTIPDGDAGEMVSRLAKITGALVEETDKYVYIKTEGQDAGNPPDTGRCTIRAVKVEHR
jgi:prepilin-type N-terminal cleavage/methylation domain-containing protein